MRNRLEIGESDKCEEGKVIMGMMMREQACFAAQVGSEDRAVVCAAAVVVHLVRFGSKTYRNLPGSNQL